MPILREGGRADAARIAALHIASWQAAYRGQLPDAFLDGQSLTRRTAEWEARLGVGGERLLLLEDHDAVLGFAAFGPSRDPDADPAIVWELYNLHVLPDRRGGGLGGQLFAAAVAEGRRARRSTLTLWVAEGNGPAREFYRRRGMHPDGRQQIHRLGPGVELPEVRYRMPIGDAKDTINGIASDAARTKTGGRDRT
jgi:ribosomal protein S18 acetylase RimI-like enzyme